jgi:hypothetical protein
MAVQLVGLLCGVYGSFVAWLLVHPGRFVPAIPAGARSACWQGVS